MPSKPDNSLKYDQGTHFEFGRNWADYSKSIAAEEINDARNELRRFLSSESLAGKTFLDIGCGSGIHALAALQLGAEHVYALDIDPDSVQTTKSVLETHWNGNNYTVRQMNIFELGKNQLPACDIVYSWGVLHHTGDMWGAIEKAATLVKPGGTLAIAIYRKTPLCKFWKWEKRLFTRSGAFTRNILTGLYMSLKVLRDLLRLKNPLRKISHYNEGTRGMHWKSDVIDWLGGYPYESASSTEIVEYLGHKDFKLVYSFKTEPEWGVFGSGCAEYRFQHRA